MTIKLKTFLTDKTKIMTKQEIIREFDIQILIEKECIKNYQKLNFNTDSEQRLTLGKIETLEKLKLKVEQL